MKRGIIGCLLSVVMILSSCNSLKNLFTVSDAEAAIRELLSTGTVFGGKAATIKGLITKESLISSFFPEEIRKILVTAEGLGFGPEINRFTTTLGNAAATTAERSVPVFLLGIKRMKIRDAIGMVKNGGTTCTDYLRTAIGDTLRRAIAPVMDSALEEYHLAGEWNKLVGPVKLLSGNRLNLDMGFLVSGLVTNLMFSKIAEKEVAIRTKAEERKSALLQKVFRGS